MDTTDIDTIQLKDVRETIPDNFRPVAINSIVALTEPYRQQSSPIESGRAQLEGIFGESLYIGTLRGDQLYPKHIEQIIEMRHAVFKNFKGWQTPDPDWNDTDIHPDTKHQLLLDKDGNVLASSRIILSEVTPTSNGHSRFDKPMFTALGSLNRGFDTASGRECNVVNKLDEIYSTHNNKLMMGTIERMCFYPASIERIPGKAAFGAALLLQSVVALKGFIDLNFTDLVIIQADDSMTNIFKGTFGQGMEEILVTQQWRMSAMKEGMSPPKLPLVPDPCHTMLFIPNELIEQVRVYNPAMYEFYVSLMS